MHQHYWYQHVANLSDPLISTFYHFQLFLNVQLAHASKVILKYPSCQTKSVKPQKKNKLKYLHFPDADLLQCCLAVARQRTRLCRTASQSRRFPSQSAKTKKIS